MRPEIASREKIAIFTQFHHQFTILRLARTTDMKNEYHGCGKGLAGYPDIA
jgi:hypothetical protein